MDESNHFLEIISQDFPDVKILQDIMRGSEWLSLTNVAVNVASPETLQRPITLTVQDSTFQYDRAFFHLSVIGGLLLSALTRLPMAALNFSYSVMEVTLDRLRSITLHFSKMV